jgi:hypothetical protein
VDSHIWHIPCSRLDQQVFSLAQICSQILHFRSSVNSLIIKSLSRSNPDDMDLTLWLRLFSLISLCPESYNIRRTGTVYRSCFPRAHGRISRRSIHLAMQPFHRREFARRSYTTGYTIIHRSAPAKRPPGCLLPRGEDMRGHRKVSAPPDLYYKPLSFAFFHAFTFNHLPIIFRLTAILDSRYSINPYLEFLAS